jgi:hypothetical protein
MDSIEALLLVGRYGRFLHTRIVIVA